MSRVAIVTDSASDLPPEVAAAAGITVVPARRELRGGVVPAQRQPHHRRVLGPHDAPRMRRSPPRPRPRPATSGRPTRRRSTPGPTPSSASPSRGTSRARSSRRRSRRRACPDREIHVDRLADRLDGPRDARPDRRGAGGARAGRAPRSRPRSRSARPASTCTSPSTRSSTSSVAAGSAAPGRRWARCSRSSPSSPSSTASWRMPTGCGRAPRRASAAWSCSPRGPWSGRRSCTRPSADVEAFRARFRERVRADPAGGSRP